MTVEESIVMNPQLRKPKYTNHNGFLMPIGCPPEGFTSGISYEAQPGDIFITTYPKCGTTWTQNIVWLIQHEGEPFPTEKIIFVEMPHLEEAGKEAVMALPTPRVIKTHLPFSMNPYHSEAKYIYVTRNPFDCAVSLYYHTKRFVEYYDFADGTFEEFFECFMAGEVDSGDYFDHLLSWYEHKNDENVLFLVYENMKENPKEAILKIAEFLGHKYSSKLNSQEILSKILYHSSFEKMSQCQKRWTGEGEEMGDRIPFIRKGIVGDWRNHFSQEQEKRLVEKFIARTKGSDIAKLWMNVDIPITQN